MEIAKKLEKKVEKFDRAFQAKCIAERNYEKLEMYVMENLKEEGKSFIFISHKMPEIFRIADRYTVLRNGEFIQSGNIKDVTAQEVTSVMHRKMPEASRLR